MSSRAAIVPGIYTVTRGPRLPVRAHRVRAGGCTGHEHGPRLRARLRAGRDGGPRRRDHDRHRPGLPDRHHVRRTVPNGTAAANRSLVIDNPPSAAFGGRGGTQVCAACVSIQRWTTTPDPIAGGPYIDLFSNGEFTSATHVQGFTSFFISPDVLLLGNQPLAPGDHDLVLDQTTSGTVTCSGCCMCSDERGRTGAADQGDLMHRRTIRTRVLGVAATMATCAALLPGCAYLARALRGRARNRWQRRELEPLALRRRSLDDLYVRCRQPRAR